MLTHAQIKALFTPLRETSNLAVRDVFFTTHMHARAPRTILGAGHAFAGTSVGHAAHAAATFDRLRPRLAAPIRFEVVLVVAGGPPGDDDGGSPEGTDEGEDALPAVVQWAAVQLRGHAIRCATGLPYENDYIWLCGLCAEGRIVQLRSLFDTKMAEEVLADPDPREASGEQMRGNEKKKD